MGESRVRHVGVMRRRVPADPSQRQGMAPGLSLRALDVGALGRRGEAHVAS
jgi:hypothetical protein